MRNITANQNIITMFRSNLTRTSTLPIIFYKNWSAVDKCKPELKKILNLQQKYFLPMRQMSYNKYNNNIWANDNPHRIIVN